jgi:hypothetical protein
MSGLVYVKNDPPLEKWLRITNSVLNPGFYSFSELLHWGGGGVGQATLPPHTHPTHPPPAGRRPVVS